MWISLVKKNQSKFYCLVKQKSIYNSCQFCHICQTRIIYSVYSLRLWKCTIKRSEEHTSELQSQSNLVCRLLLEKKKNKRQTYITPLLPIPNPNSSHCTRTVFLSCLP